MAIDRSATIVQPLVNIDQYTLTAPIHDGAIDLPGGSGEDGIGFRTLPETAPVAALHGKRILFNSTDLTGGEFITFQAGSNAYDCFSRLDTLANGGLRITFEDSKGNYKRHHLFGSDFRSDPNIAGDLKAFRSMGRARNIDDGQIYYISRNSQPQVSSGVLDWSDIVAIEIGMKPITTQFWNYAFSISRLGVAGYPMGFGGSANSPLILKDFNEAFRNSPTEFTTPKVMQIPPSGFMAATQTPYLCTHGIKIGDGVTPTYFKDSNFEISFYASADVFLNYPDRLFDDGYGAAVHDSLQPTRSIIFDTPPDITTYEMPTFGCSGVATDTNEYFIDNLPGSFLPIKNGSIVNASYFEMRNTQANRMNFVNVLELRLSDETTASNCQIGQLAANAKGIIPSGNNAAFGATINDSNAGNEITLLDTGQDANYDLTGLRTEGQVINIHYEGAANTAIVQLDPSVLATSTSAGGTVVIVNASTVNVSVKAVDLLTGLPVEGASVRVVEALTGNAVVVGVTDANGDISANFSVSSSVALAGTVRKASLPGVRYKPASIVGNVTAAGFSAVVQLVTDE